MANEKIQLKNALKKAENNLYKITKELKETESLYLNLKETYDALSLMEKITEENPALTPIASKEIKEKKLVSLYKQMEEELTALKERINSFEDKAMRTKLFLENFRTTRIYEFKNTESMTEFIKQAYPLFSISRVLFKPEFVGTVNLEEIAGELKEEAKGNQILSVSTEKIADLIGIIEKNTN